MSSSGLYKKHFIENDKTHINNSNVATYNLNSFRGNSNQNNLANNDKMKQEMKLMSPRFIVLSDRDKTDKDCHLKLKQQVKPRLLTGKLPLAFDVGFKRYGGDIPVSEDVKPKKLIHHKQESLYQINTNNLNICITEDDDLLDKNSAKNSKKNNHSRIFVSDSDSNGKPHELKNITKPIVIKTSTTTNVSRVKSSSPAIKEKEKNKEKSILQNNFLIKNSTKNINYNYSNGNSDSKDSKSTVNNSHGSNSNLHSNTDKKDNPVKISRTHDSFFPKIKNSFDLGDIENGQILNEINKKFNSNENNNLNNVISEGENTNFSNIPKNKDNTIRLEDCISLSIIQNFSNSRIKKVFNVPNFEIYSILEIPINSKIFVNKFQEKINNWNNKIGNSQKFIKIFNQYINSPEGYVSLVLEYMNGFTLHDIIENIGCLNESVMSKLATQILQCLKEYSNKCMEDFGEYFLNSIIFDKKGNMKIMPNIFSFTNSNEIDNTFHFKMKNLIDMNLLNFYKRQFFYLGYILLTCATGGLKFNSLEYLIHNYDDVIREIKKTSSKLNCSCLLHLMVYIEEGNCVDYEKLNFSKLENKLKISNFLNKKYFSNNFIDFLCISLSLDNNNFDETKISNHLWINVNSYVKLNNKFNNVRVSMKELIKTTNSLVVSFKANPNDKKRLNFLNNFEVILSYSILLKQEVKKCINKKSVVKEICNEIGINQCDLLENLSSYLQ